MHTQSPSLLLTQGHLAVELNIAMAPARTSWADSFPHLPRNFPQYPQETCHDTQVRYTHHGVNPLHVELFP